MKLTRILQRGCIKHNVAKVYERCIYWYRIGLTHDLRLILSDTVRADTAYGSTTVGHAGREQLIRKS
jgi:hypothetical protein